MENLLPLISQFKKYLSTSGRGLSTVNCYGSDIRSFVAYLTEQGVSPKRAELIHLTSFCDELKNAKKESPNSLRRKIISVRQFYKYLFESGQIEANPFMESIIPERNEALPPLLSEEELEEVFEVAESQENPIKRTRDLALLHLLSLEGLKVSELIALRWVDYLGSQEKPSSLRIKGEKDRTLLLDPRTTKALGEYKSTLQESKDPLFKGGPMKPIFLAFKGKGLTFALEQITRHGLKFLLYDLGAKAGLEKLNTERLRHYAIHFLLEKYGELAAVKSHLGLKRAGNILKHLAKQKKEHH